MKAVVQRVLEASVNIGGARFSEIGHGLLILIGIEHTDDISDIQWLGDKILNIRVFRDAHKPINASLADVSGDIMVISQFTLHASTKKGNRPSFTGAATPDKAEMLYERFIQHLKNSFDGNIATGKFGEDMQVRSINDGPVTIIIDSKNRI